MTLSTLGLPDAIRKSQNDVPNTTMLNCHLQMVRRLVKSCKKNMKKQKYIHNITFQVGYLLLRTAYVLHKKLAPRL